MMQVRKAADRGHADFGWLDSRHTFSFGEYYDPAFMGFGPLRVINDDRIAPGGGFGMHGHRDMEIVTYVLEGALAHKDSLGTGSTITPGEVQRMSAGVGIRHSEFNESATQAVHLLQIWLLPKTNGIAPSYEQRSFPDIAGRLRLVASDDGREGSVTIHSDAALYATILANGDSVGHRFADGRIGWVQVARGSLEVNGVKLEEGDGLAIAEENALTLVAGESGAEALLFDMAR